MTARGPAQVQTLSQAVETISVAANSASECATLQHRNRHNFCDKVWRSWSVLRAIVKETITGFRSG